MGWRGWDEKGGGSRNFGEGSGYGKGVWRYVVWEGRAVNVCLEGV